MVVTSIVTSIVTCWSYIMCGDLLASIFLPSSRMPRSEIFSTS